MSDDDNAREFIDLIENRFDFDEREKLREIHEQKDWLPKFWELIHNSKNPKVIAWYKERLDRICGDQYKKMKNKKKFCESP